MRHYIAPLIVLLVSVAPVAAQENGVLQQLLHDGIMLNDGTVVKLPLPSLADQLDLATQSEALQEIRDRYPLDQFTRPSRVAPFVLKMKSLDGKQGRTGQTVDVWFVAYGSLAAIEKHELFDQLGNLEASQDAANTSHVLTVQELAQRNIKQAAPTPESEERYVHSGGVLLDRVDIRGVTRTVITRGKDSTLAAGVLDTRFQNDSQFPNQWRSQQKNPQGQLVYGPPISYAGFGGYAKATKLIEPDGALLIELHVVFDEPSGWFGKANLLRSKLPIVVQNNVREFRTKLMKASE